MRRPHLARPRRLALGTASLALLLLLASAATADVTIHCLDVGQADATLIVSSSGKTLLVDGGGSSGTVAKVQAVVSGQLDYTVATHYHSDHIGGLDDVIEDIGVKTACYDRGWDYSTATYGYYATAAGAKRQTIVDGQVIDLGDGVTVTCLGVNGNGQLSSPFDNDDLENEYCVILLVECGDFDFFVAGDLTGGYGGYKDIETSVGPEAGDIEVYRVDHHGSYSSSNESFLAATTPETAIISVPESSSYGHPHQDTMDRLAAAEADVYQTEIGSDSTYPADMRTIVGGNVVITTDGHGEYFIDGDQWAMDEPDLTDVPPAADFVLLGNHPNPFNPATEIRFRTAAEGPVRLTVFDLAGRRLDARMQHVGAGEQSIRWDGRGADGRALPSGVYMYRVETASGSEGGRMMLVR